MTQSEMLDEETRVVEVGAARARLSRAERACVEAVRTYQPDHLHSAHAVTFARLELEAATSSLRLASTSRAVEAAGF